MPRTLLIPAPVPALLVARVVALVVAPLLAGCDATPPATATLHAAGELRVATLNGGITYYEGVNGTTGLEYELASRFAAFLGVAPRFIVAHDTAALETLLKRGKAHVAAAMLPVRALDDPALAFGPTYAVARQLVVVRRSKPRPRDVAALVGQHGVVSRGRGAAAAARQELPPEDGHQWQATSDDTDQLLGMVDSGEADYAVLPAFDFHAARAYFPELLPAFELGQPHAIAWLSRTHLQNSLWHAQLAFLRQLRASGELDQLAARWLDADEFDYVESRAFLRHYESRLPAYRDAFIEVAQRLGFDWLLLAAMGYQESHWRADARSPTGVRGLMMLTTNTAQALGVDRLDPLESIDGGARYLKRLLDRLPQRIAEPDRTWLALAAYNIGFGHLEDARVLAARAGDDPDAWSAVRKHLPRLSNRRVARTVKRGYARGYQAVHFVDNIRRYYELLHWLTGGREQYGPPAPRPPAELVSPVL